jgi:hypothetical protein
MGVCMLWLTVCPHCNQAFVNDKSMRSHVTQKPKCRQAQAVLLKRKLSSSQEGIDAAASADAHAAAGRATQAKRAKLDRGNMKEVALMKLTSLRYDKLLSDATVSCVKDTVTDLLKHVRTQVEAAITPYLSHNVPSSWKEVFTPVFNVFEVSGSWHRHPAPLIGALIITAGSFWLLS